MIEEAQGPEERDEQEGEKPEENNQGATNDGAAPSAEDADGDAIDAEKGTGV